MNFGVESLEKAVRLEVLAEAAAQKRGITTKTYVFCLEASIHPTGMHGTCR